MTQPLFAVLPLRGLVIFPGMMHVFAVGRASSVRAVEEHLDQKRELLLVPQLDTDVEDPLKAELAEVGVQVAVLRVSSLPDGSLRVLVEGRERLRRVSDLSVEDGATCCQVASLPEPDDDPIETAALSRQLGVLHEEYLLNTGVTVPEQQLIVASDDNPGRLVDQVAAMLHLPLIEQVAVLEERSVRGRLLLVIDQIAVAVAAQRISTEVANKVQFAMDSSQREYHLKEQLKVIRAELGTAASSDTEADLFAERVAASGMPEDVAKEALREIDRLRTIQVESAEYTISRTWLEAVCDFPWSKATVDRTDLHQAQKVLDADHFGLKKVKERVLEYLAVRQLQPASKGPILCFVGPPGVGKTSLGKSIANSLGRTYGRVALGGIKDENEIRGHRRTYIGALPGRIVRALIRAETNNPVIVLDELDKVGNDFRGDPASALLEVLDPEQNAAFVDHYLDVPVDLSQVLFIATANVVDTIPSALLDRLEVIELPGYPEEDKLQIARRFLLPKLGQNHGLSGAHLSVESAAIERTIREYTREAGVRELERQLATVHRKVARLVVEGRKKRLRISERALPRYLGPQRYYQELAERVDQPGVVIGLAWTAAGGDILFIEAARMPGKGPSLKLTGSLGDVMKESAEAAMSWLRAGADRYGLKPAAFEAAFHLHVPAGAIPKDGPSAGVTMVTALASLVLDRKVKARLAMTGEITLRGKVLPVGGVKEKILAARRAGVREVVLPARNEADLQDIPEVLRRDVRFHFVERVDEVLELALV